MRLYEYECAVCKHRQEANKTFEQRHEMETCEKCGGACEYIMSPTPGFMKGGPTVPTGKRRIK